MVVPTAGVIRFEQMSNAITVRLPEDLGWKLQRAKAGIPKGRIVQEEPESPKLRQTSVPSRGRCDCWTKRPLDAPKAALANEGDRGQG